MKLTLKGCEHRAVEQWGQPTDDAIPVTCINCYERLMLGRFAYPLNLKPALPPAPCSHPSRKPVAAQITKRMPYRDAICEACGVIQRHPDGRGVWTDVMFYGYVIKEEP